MSSAAESKALSSAKSQTLLSPNLQLMVTGFGLFVGFFCGMMVSWMMFSPGIDKIRELSILTVNEQYEKAMIAAVARTQPQAYQAALQELQPAARQYIVQTAGPGAQAAPAAAEASPAP
jgi:hypothetical protein